MEWEPVFILGVTCGTLLISVARNVLGTEGSDGRRPAPHRRKAGAGAAPRTVRRI
jgi:hypothetical protein